MNYHPKLTSSTHPKHPVLRRQTLAFRPFSCQFQTVLPREGQELDLVVRGYVLRMLLGHFLTERAYPLQSPQRLLLLLLSLTVAWIATAQDWTLNVFSSIWERFLQKRKSEGIDQTSEVNKPFNKIYILEMWELRNILNDSWTFSKLFPQKNDFWARRRSNPQPSDDRWGALTIELPNSDGELRCNFDIYATWAEATIC